MTNKFGLNKVWIAGMTAALAIGSIGVMRAQSGAHVIQTPAEVKWGPAPPMLPAGAQIAVLAGDPGKSVPFTIRLKFPANYAIPAHSHPTDEHVVVVAGALSIGMGDKLSKTAAGTRRSASAASR